MPSFVYTVRMASRDHPAWPGGSVPSAIGVGLAGSSRLRRYVDRCDGPTPRDENHGTNLRCLRLAKWQRTGDFRDVRHIHNAGEFRFNV